MFEVRGSGQQKVRGSGNRKFREGNGAGIGKVRKENREMGSMEGKSERDTLHEGNSWDGKFR